MQLLFLSFITCALSATFIDNTQAQNVLDNLSLGHTTRTGSDVPNWIVTGSEDHKPRVMSDRIMLTPPWPGNKRGALWAQNPMTSQYWTAELEFRVSGPPGGGGNLNVWYAKDKSGEKDMSSIYSIDKFDGLGLLLDQYSGRGGTLRGFLNDGSTSYKSGLDIHKLAFSHCEFAYRNLGRFSKMVLRQAADGFTVTLDDRPCFSSDKIHLPSNYYFGISGASAENADSIEISSFIVKSEASTGAASSSSPPPPQNVPQPGGSSANTQNVLGGQQGSSQMNTAPPQAEDLRSVFTVLQQLQSAVQDLSNRVSNQNNDIQNLANKPTSGSGGAGAGAGASTGNPDQLNSMARRLETIEHDLASVKKTLDDHDFKDHLQDVHDRMEDIQHHMQTIMPSTVDLNRILQTSSPRLGFFLFVILAFQGMLAASYIVYKRRRANSPKKLL